MRTSVSAVWYALRTRLTARVAWDVVMVYIAIANLTLLTFDFTYLWLRPAYFEYLPLVTQVYDPVKGIVPHPDTRALLDRVDRLDVLVARGAPAADLDAELAELRRATREELAANPFERSGQTWAFRALERRVIDLAAADLGVPASSLDTVDAFDWFWNVPREALPARLARFDEVMRPALARNFHRDYGLDGRLEDHFWLLDLPFLAVFALEFFGRWGWSVYRREYPRWFIFPILNWYDLLSLVPVKELRFLRLFRVASIYVRLRRSGATGLTSDPVSRVADYLFTILKEEVSDMVTLRILSETHAEIRAGTHRRIVRAVVTPRRDRLARELAARVQHALASTEVRDRVRTLVQTHLDQSVESAGALRNLPLPNAVLAPLVRAIGEVVFDSFADTMADTLQTEEGRRTLEAVLADTIDGIVVELTDGELEAVIREVSLETIDHIKAHVRVRKWLQDPGRSPAPGGPPGHGPS